MKTSLIAATLVAGLLAGPTWAKTYELPDANPAASVTLPDTWKPTDVEKGVEATSPDGETYVAFETATQKGMEALIDEDIAFLTKQGVKIDKNTQQKADLTVNGVPGTMLTWKGKDKDGPTAVTLGIFGVSDKVILLMTAWSSPAGDKANGDALTAMVNSIKRP